MRANYQVRNKLSRVIQGKISQPVTQKMAWVVSRPLGQIPYMGPLPNPQPNLPMFNPLNVQVDNGNIHHNHAIHHRHIVFSQNMTLPTGQNDNIGFHCVDGNLFGQGALFSEPWRNLGYRMHRQISNGQNRNVPGFGLVNNDNLLIRAINLNNPPGYYTLWGNNCQHWVERVENTYNNF